MKQLMNLRLFSVGRKPSQSAEYQTYLKQAYDEFLEQLSEKLREQKDHSKVYSDLSFIRLELVGILEDLTGEVKKKCKDHFKQGYIIN